MSTSTSLTSTAPIDNVGIPALPVVTSQKIIQKALAPKATKKTKAGRKASKQVQEVPVVLDPLSDEAVLNRLKCPPVCACKKLLVCNGCNVKHDLNLKPGDLCIDNRDTNIKEYDSKCWCDGVGLLPCFVCHASGKWSHADVDHSMMVHECDMCPFCLVNEPGYGRCKACNANLAPIWKE